MPTCSLCSCAAHHLDSIGTPQRRRRLATMSYRGGGSSEGAERCRMSCGGHTAGSHSRQLRARTHRPPSRRELRLAVHCRNHTLVLPTRTAHSRPASHTCTAVKCCLIPSMDSCSPSQSVALATKRAKIHGAARGVSISSSCSSILLGYRLGWVAEMANSSSGASGLVPLLRVLFLVVVCFLRLFCLNGASLQSNEFLD